MKKRVTVSIDPNTFSEFKKKCDLTPYSRVVEFLMKKALQGGVVADPNCIVIKLMNGDMAKLRTLCINMNTTISGVIKKLLESDNFTKEQK